VTVRIELKSHTWPRKPWPWHTRLLRQAWTVAADEGSEFMSRHALAVPMYGYGEMAMERLLKSRNRVDPRVWRSSMFKRVVLLAALLAALPCSVAHAQVRIGIGIGVPVYPYYRPYYRPYGVYVAPTVVVAPAPVVYAAPPPVVYAQPGPVVVPAPTPAPAPQQMYVQTSPGVFQPVSQNQISASPPPNYNPPTPAPAPPYQQ
jgi:hypothetical protein